MEAAHPAAAATPKKSSGISIGRNNEEENGGHVTHEKIRAEAAANKKKKNKINETDPIQNEMRTGRPITQLFFLQVGSRGIAIQNSNGCGINGNDDLVRRGK